MRIIKTFESIFAERERERVQLNKENLQTFLAAFLAAVLLFSGIIMVHAATQSPTLSVTVQTTLTFIATTDNFAALTPGTPVYATTTLDVTTNDANGWTMTLSGSNVTATAAAMNDGAGHDIADLTPQWFVAASTATTTGGNGAAITNGQDALAFRVMSASSTNGVPFLSTAWWGTSDAQFNAAQKWAGMASTTNLSHIGRAGAGSYSATRHVNTIQYYLDAPATQATGAYTGPLTYTAVGQ